MATDPKTVHIWMRDNRSLCDRRARPHDPLTDEEAAARERESAEAPACGSCLVVLQELAHDGGELVEMSGGRVWPAEPREAYRNLEGTRWADLAAEADEPDVAEGYPFVG